MNKAKIQKMAAAETANGKNAGGTARRSTAETVPANDVVPRILSVQELAASVAGGKLTPDFVFALTFANLVGGIDFSRDLNGERQLFRVALGRARAATIMFFSEGGML